ncbi:MAG: ubiquinone biosynthesis regulatory protein kinase UbiB, partial [Pseudohongiellaceae bacterium]
MKLYFRLLKIYRVAIRYRLHELLDGAGRGKSLSVLLRLPLASTAASRTLTRGARLRLALEELGPIFIKFGQLLSTRRDLLPEDLADELAYLQDRAPPFPGAQARAIIEQALGADIHSLFDNFSAEPLASASIAQVHTGTLPGGEEVAIKVIRPGVEAIIAQDIKLLHRIARLMEKYLIDGKRLRPREVVADYEHVIFDELNLQVEAANTSQLRRNFENSQSLYVPKVYWDYSRRNVLVMERIHGIPVTNVQALKSAGINLKKLAETGVQIFFTQVFNHSFFHADMHPGNIFVSPEDPENPQYIAIDCAIIGSLSKQDQYYLARNLLAIFKRDYRRVAELHVECGWVPADTPVNAFEATMRSVCEPIFEKPLKDISFGVILLQLFQTARRFDMQVQPSLVLLQKTLLNVEGLGKQLYPDLDLWQTA